MLNKKSGVLMGKIRRERNVSGVQGAELMEMSQPMLLRVENGNAPITLEILEKFCLAYNMSPANFMLKSEDVVLLAETVPGE